MGWDIYGAFKKQFDEKEIIKRQARNLFKVNV